MLLYNKNKKIANPLDLIKKNCYSLLWKKKYLPCSEQHERMDYYAEDNYYACDH